MKNPASPAPRTCAGLVLVRVLLPVALSIGACGSHDQLEGTWVRTDFPTAMGNKPCTEELTLDVGEFTSTLSCRLTEGTYGQEVTVGHYRRNETALIVNALQSSCPNQSKAETTWYVLVDRDHLEKTEGNVTTNYDRGKAKVDGVVVRGCFDADLANFDEGPVVDLP